MEFVYTERAHLMCPRMYFGIVSTVNEIYNEKKIKESIDTLCEAHPFLKALLGYGPKTNLYFYRITEDPKVELILTQKEADPDEILQTYEKLTSREWNLFEEGMLKVVAWKKGEQTVFLLVFNHLLADGRGALGLTYELAERFAYEYWPQIAPERLISPQYQFREDAKMPWLSQTLVNNANEDWMYEDRKPLSYEEYREIANRFLAKDQVKYSIREIDPQTVSEMLEGCHNHSVTMNDLLLAEMFLEEGTDKIIMAKDIRKEFDFIYPGSLGNYSTAFSVGVKLKPKDKFKLAKVVHRKVQDIIQDPQRLYLVLQCYRELDPGLLDAAFPAAIGEFKSKAAKFIGKRFFGFASPKGYSITNLGKLDCDCIETAYFIPPASPAVKKTWGVLTVNGKMTICISER